MFKKLISILLASVMMLSLVACSATITEKTELDKAKDTVNGFMTGLKDLDGSKMQSLVSKESKDLIDSGSFNKEELIKENGELPYNIINQLKFNFKSGEVDKESTTTSLNYEIVIKDLKQIYLKLLENAFSGENPEEILKDFDINTLSDNTIEVAIPLVKEDGEWKIDFTEELIAEIFGLKDFLSIPDMN